MYSYFHPEKKQMYFDTKLQPGKLSATVTSLVEGCFVKVSAVSCRPVTLKGRGYNCRNTLCINTVSQKKFLPVNFL